MNVEGPVGLSVCCLYLPCTFQVEAGSWLASLCLSFLVWKLKSESVNCRIYRHKQSYSFKFPSLGQL